MSSSVDSFNPTDYKLEKQDKFPGYIIPKLSDEYKKIKEVVKPLIIEFYSKFELLDNAEDEDDLIKKYTRILKGYVPVKDFFMVIKGFADKIKINCLTISDGNISRKYTQADGKYSLESETKSDRINAIIESDGFVLFPGTKLTLDKPFITDFDKWDKEMNVTFRASLPGLSGLSGSKGMSDDVQLFDDICRNKTSIENIKKLNSDNQQIILVIYKILVTQNTQSVQIKTLEKMIQQLSI